MTDGTIAIGTIDHGLLLMLVPHGSLLRHLRPRENPVPGVYEDR